MKRSIVLASFIVIIASLLFSLWWYMEPRTPGGVYPEKHAGSIVIEYEEDFPMSPFEFPVRWIKSHPWEETPILEEVKMYDESGEVIAFIEGQYKLDLNDHQNKWNEKNVGAKIELYLNGSRVAEEGISTTRIKKGFQQVYNPATITFKYRGNTHQFSLVDTFRYIPIKETKLVGTDFWGIEGLMYLEDPNSKIPKGFIVYLAGPVKQALEEILFWLPGMSENYLTSKVLYSYGENLDQYMNYEGEFDGIPLSLPLTLTNDRMLIYFPFTDEIKQKTIDSLTHIMPSFIFKNTDEEIYHIGGTGMIGSLDRESSRENLILLPKK